MTYPTARNNSTDDANQINFLISTKGNRFDMKVRIHQFWQWKYGNIHPVSGGGVWVLSLH